MGTFSVLIQVGGLENGQFVDVEALVDTGSSHTLLPKDLLTQIGTRAIETVSFELADERVVEYEVGEARIRLDGRERSTLVVFGPEGVTPLLGATTLQLFNLAVDPLREQLMSVTGLLKQLRWSKTPPPRRPIPRATAAAHPRGGAGVPGSGDGPGLPASVR